MLDVLVFVNDAIAQTDDSGNRDFRMRLRCRGAQSVERLADDRELPFHRRACDVAVMYSSNDIPAT
jgi:hypothetical protein